MIYSLLLLLLTQVSVSSTGISVSDGDINSVLSPILNWSGSLFNVVIAFAGVIVAIFFVKLMWNGIFKHNK